MRREDFRSDAPGRLVRIQDGGDAFVPDSLPRSFPVEKCLGDLVEATWRLGELSGVGTNLVNPHLLVRPFLRREAVATSRIEGTQASLDDLFVYEASPASKAQTASDVREVHNYVRAHEQALLALEKMPICSRLIREAHGILLQGVRGSGSRGQFRRVQNWIGSSGTPLEDARYVPPPPQLVPDLIADLESFVNEDHGIPALIMAPLIHYQFEAIHPFVDGNGRLGRLLLSILLKAKGVLSFPLLYLSPYFEARRQQYYNLLLAVSQRGEWSEWIAFFLRAVVSQAKDATRRSTAMRDLRNEYRERLAKAGSSALLPRLVDLLFESPALTVNRAAELLGVTYQGASGLVRKLEAEGILTEITGQKRNRIHMAQGILEALQRPLTT